MRLRAFFVLVLVLVLSLLAVSARADILGSAATYAVIGGSGVTNAGAGVLGATVITGSVAALAANSCTGIGLCDGGPGIINGGTAQGGNATALGVEGVGGVDTAELALLATPVPPANNLTGLTLGVGSQASLAPGVYSFSTTAGLLNTLTLAGGGAAAPLWIFEIGSGLTTGSDSHVLITGAGAASAGVYWVIGTGGQTGGRCSHTATSNAAVVPTRTPEAHSADRAHSASSHTSASRIPRFRFYSLSFAEEDNWVPTLPDGRWSVVQDNTQE